MFYFWVLPGRKLRFQPWRYSKTPELSEMVFPRTLCTDKGLLRILRVHPSEAALAETAGHRSTALEALPSSESPKQNQWLHCFTSLELGMDVYAATDNCPRRVTGSPWHSDLFHFRTWVLTLKVLPKGKFWLSSATGKSPLILWLVWMLESDLCPERCDGGYSQGFSLRKDAVEQTQRRRLPRC